ncbi:50S ribosomal protein L3 N(5)-glutamine methyltransferase [Sediminicurvatus halobius]|uniref:50S ribosomal protein L3 N(5)-glutamine methyltransferase n=1 Tax=Sediminicurvatus halobius TaxID=2182432 RepID=A0A2U2MWV0_9GAMM|nr:50S ribosomal protein L3 N(5)-glutamine methyltransferase [Spiribacter halobius]PWG61302.1 50S ribosomal protein L3 N(5)-glutamine methyltransferase [Spiribacter halobius]UEX78976.1 50S ribosomal protein L3 N(5)-glutamine methyltransferase [Spiribacter halobius]
MTGLPESPPPELETVGDYVRWAASRFQAAGLAYGHGTDNALDEAAALVLATLQLPPDLHAAYFSCRVTAPEKAALLAAVRERVQVRRPLPYITGEAWFCGLAFRVDERVLIPRSPIAELIEAGFQPWLDPDRVQRIADVGTGSGCIAIACALAFPGAEVAALDLSEAALALARENAERHGVTERVRCARSDLLAAVPAEPAWDLIVSNPPYVDSEAMAALPPEYRHEPRDALAAGSDGLDLVHRLLPEAARRLSDHGLLVCEVGHSRPALEAAYPDLPVTWVELERGGTGVFVADAEALRRQFIQ